MSDLFEPTGGPPDTAAIRARLIAAYRALLDIRGVGAVEHTPAHNALLASLRDLGEHVDTVDALRTALRSAVHALDTASIWLDRPGLHEGMRGAESAAAAARAALGDFAKPAASRSDARAVLGNDAFHAYRDCGVSARMDGKARPTEGGSVGDAMREGWDDEDRRQARAASDGPIDESGVTAAQASEYGAQLRRARYKRPTEAGRRWDVAREGWDAEDARIALAEDRDVGATCAPATKRDRVTHNLRALAAGCDAHDFDDLLSVLGANAAGRRIGDEDCEGNLADEDDGAPDAAGEAGGLP